MKSKLFFVSGFFCGFFAVFVWLSASQEYFFRGLIYAIQRKGEIVTPMTLPANSPQVLGEVATIDNSYNFGQIYPNTKVLAQGAVAFDVTDNKVIFEKDSHQKLPAASTVKIVTAAVALDKGSLDEPVTVGLFPTTVGESSMGLQFGQKLTLEELLSGLLMVSGNDAAEAIAQGLAGNRDIFVSWMNDYAKKIGANETNFTTPSGLDEEGQYTTAYDLFLMGRHIFKTYPEVQALSTTKEKYLPRTDGHSPYLLKNKLQVLDSFNFLGVKPGLGEQKMLSLVALLENNGHRIVVSIIRTPSIRHDLEQILSQI